MWTLETSFHCLYYPFSHSCICAYAYYEGGEEIRSIGFGRWFSDIPYHNSGHYLSSYLLFKIRLSSIGLYVPLRKQITSPLRAQQVNASYKFVTMVNINCRPVFYLKKKGRFRTLHSVFRWNLLRWV
jgi:hypothetical protein